MNRHIIFLLFFVMMLFSCENQSDMYEVSVIRFEKSGYGYQIDYKGKLFIKQEFIPVISCKKHFETSKRAIDIANLMIEKLSKKESPSITLKELIKKGVNTNCVASQ